MTPSKYRWLHERMADLYRDRPPRELYMAFLAAQRTEHQQRGTGLTEPVGRKVAALIASLPYFWDTTDERFVRRYYVDESLYEAMLETQPPAEAFDIDELRLPEDGVIIRWPNNEETYIVSRTRYEEIASTILGIPVELGSGSENALTWVQMEVTKQGAGAIWFSDLDTQILPPTFGTPHELDEVRQREAMIRNILIYLTTGAALEAPRTSFKEVRADSASRGGRQQKRDKERFYNYYWLGGRTREQLEIQQRNASAAEPAGRVYQYRERVSGHWKRQPFGPGRTERRWLWIMPYDRPDDPSLPYRPQERVTVVRRRPESGTSGTRPYGRPEAQQQRLLPPDIDCQPPQELRGAWRRARNSNATTTRIEMVFDSLHAPEAKWLAVLVMLEMVASRIALPPSAQTMFDHAVYLVERSNKEWPPRHVEQFFEPAEGPYTDAVGVVREAVWYLFNVPQWPASPSPLSPTQRIYTTILTQRVYVAIQTFASALAAHAMALEEARYGIAASDAVRDEFTSVYLACWEQRVQARLPLRDVSSARLIGDELNQPNWVLPGPLPHDLPPRGPEPSETAGPRDEFPQYPPPDEGGGGTGGRGGQRHRDGPDYADSITTQLLERHTAVGPVLHLKLNRHDGQEILAPWHAIQSIKNEMLGPEATAIEVYPPQDEVVDEANTRHLWVLPEGTVPVLMRPGRATGARRHGEERDPRAEIQGRVVRAHIDAMSVEVDRCMQRIGPDPDWVPTWGTVNQRLTRMPVDVAAACAAAAVQQYDRMVRGLVRRSDEEPIHMPVTAAERELALRDSEDPRGSARRVRWMGEQAARLAAGFYVEPQDADRVRYAIDPPLPVSLRYAAAVAAVLALADAWAIRRDPERLPPRQLDQIPVPQVMAGEYIDLVVRPDRSLELRHYPRHSAQLAQDGYSTIASLLDDRWDWRAGTLNELGAWSEAPFLTDIWSTDDQGRLDPQDIGALWYFPNDMIRSEVADTLTIPPSKEYGASIWRPFDAYVQPLPPSWFAGETPAHVRFLDLWWRRCRCQIPPDWLMLPPE